MYAVIEACGTYPVDRFYQAKTRRWGEPKLSFVAETLEEVQAWWLDRCENTPLRDQLRGFDYIVVIGPEGVLNLSGRPMRELPDEGWVQARLGVFGPPLTDERTLQTSGTKEETA